MQHGKRQINIFLLTILFFSLFSINTYAHNGPRDELGGHFRTADCMYLLHNPTELAQSANNIDELIQLIKENNSNTTCSSQLTSEYVDLEGYEFKKKNSGQKETVTASKPVTSQPTGQLQMGKKYEATLEKCTDGDTANFNINGTMYKTRFLYIDTPESTNKTEAFGKEASEYTCSFLKKGNIVLETDGKDLFDKYDRLLAWVWVDNQLHQEEITKAGLVKKFYDYGDYKYEDIIIAAMNEAKSNKKGMYAEASEPVVAKESNNQSKEVVKEQNASQVEEQSDEDDSSPLSGGVIVLIILAFIIFRLVKRKK